MGKRPFKLKITRERDGHEQIKSFLTREARDKELAKMQRHDSAEWARVYHLYESGC